MKKLTTALLAVCAVSTAAMADAGAFNGFYLGANAGVASTTSKYDWKNTNTTGTASLSSTSTGASTFQSGKNSNAGQAGLYAGYNMQMGQMIVGGEGYVSLDSTKKTLYDDTGYSSDPKFRVTLKRTMFYGLAARFGFVVSPSTMLYVRLAAESGKWTMNSVAAPDTSSSGNASIKTAAANTVNGSKNGVYFVPGLGIETAVAKNLLLRAEGTYTFAPTVTLNQDTTYLEGVNGTSVKHTSKTSQVAVKLGLAYKF
jgi:hypothetical protein